MKGKAEVLEEGKLGIGGGCSGLWWLNIDK